jgi:hypothetical protein
MSPNFKKVAPLSPKFKRGAVSVPKVFLKDVKMIESDKQYLMVQTKEAIQKN